MNYITKSFLAAAFVVLMFSCSDKDIKITAKSGADAQDGSTFSALMVVETAKGVIKIQLLEDKAPKTVDNILKLAGKKYYDGLKFFRVEPKKFILAGDPMNTGEGGSGYDINAEINDVKNISGAVGMARLPDIVNPNKNSNGSQFYICLAAQPEFDGEFTVFGQVVAGFDVLTAITAGDVMERVYVIENNPKRRN